MVVRHEIPSKSANGSKHVFERRLETPCSTGSPHHWPYVTFCEILIKESGVKCQHLLPWSQCPWHFNGLLIQALHSRQLASCFNCD